MFRLTQDSFSRWMLMLVFHTAAVYELLGSFGYKVLLSMAVFSDIPEQTEWLRQLFSWFGDPALTPDQSPQNLARSILFRNNQPIVVEDCGRLNNKAASMEILEDALVNGAVSCKVGRKDVTLSIQGPIIILSNRLSALTLAPEVFVLDLCPETFDYEYWQELEGRIADNRDYLTAFIGFTGENISKLQESLRQGRKLALQYSRGDLNGQCLEMLGILLGMNDFLWEFFGS